MVNIKTLKIMKVTKSLVLLVLCLTITMLSCDTEEATLPIGPIEQESILFTEEVLNELVNEAMRSSKDDSSQFGDIQTVDFVDLERYVGRWFELAKFPTFFNSDCKCTTADYEASINGVRVLNNCTSIVTEEFNTISGNAEIVDTQSNAKLKVYFDNIPFPGDYWIIDLVAFNNDDPYDFAVVGEPNRESLFILSRTPKLRSLKDKVTLVKILVKLKRQGYDIRKIKISPQFSDCDYL